MDGMTRWWTPIVRRVALLALALILVMGVIYFKQDAEWRRAGWTKKYHDLYYLPSPPVLQRLSLGHYSFLADLIWIRGLLYVGTHFSNQHGSIGWLSHYANAVLKLEPKFRYAYIWASVLSIYNRKKTTRRDVLTSISFQKRAQAQFPNDYYFPYLLGMSYISELTLSHVSMGQLVQDFRDYCPKNKKPLLTIAPRLFQWQKCSKNPFEWLGNPQCAPQPFLASAAGFFEQLKRERPSKRIPFLHQIKRCLRKKGALYLMEAASKEGAPPHYAPLAARIMRRNGSAGAAVCDHLLNVLWRAENNEVRLQIRKKIKRFCGNKRPKEIICQEEVFAKRWRKQFPYLPRATFQMLNLPPSLESQEPIHYPPSTVNNICTYGSPTP